MTLDSFQQTSSKPPHPYAREVTPLQRLEQMFEKMPPAPPVAFKLVPLLNMPDVHVNTIMDVIKYDPNLTTRLLRICNSAYLAPTQAVRSVEQAIMRLGFKKTAELAIIVSMGVVYTKAEVLVSFDIYHLWTHSVAAAVAAKHLGSLYKQEPPLDSDLLFTIGLLHDVGKMVFNSLPAVYAEKYHQLMQGGQISASGAEKEVFGFEHAEVGGLLMQRWNMPQEIVVAVRHHSAPEWETSGPYACFAQLASLCANRLTSSDQATVEYAATHSFAMKRLGFSKDDLVSTMEHLVQEEATIESFMLAAFL